MRFFILIILMGLGIVFVRKEGRGSHFTPFLTIFSAVLPHADATATTHPSADKPSARVSTWLSAPPTSSESISIKIFIFRVLFLISLRAAGRRMRKI